MAEKRVLKKEKKIALIAHDKKKQELVNWAETNKERLGRHKLYATGTTGKLIEEKTGVVIEKLFSGPLGGDQQVGALIAENNLDLLIFFWDPMEAQPHDSDVKALLRLAVAWNILIANNRTSADFIMASALMNEDYVFDVPDYSNYK
ncbi:MAG TPA: methylglyoxal synthase [Chitinophagaceae bacterium]|nr:methylglyoxal synthase [Chitinophagaceae bacterium]